MATSEDAKTSRRLVRMDTATSRDEDVPTMSPVEESDSGFLSPPEAEPNPGLDGVPVRCESHHLSWRT